MTTRKTMTASRMAWALRHGSAWPEPADDCRFCELYWTAAGGYQTYWTAEGGYQWNIDLQAYELVF